METTYSYQRKSSLSKKMITLARRAILAAYRQAMRAITREDV